MKKIQKALVTLVAAVTLGTNVAGLAACGQSGFGDVAVEAYKGGKVTVTFHHTMGQNLQGALNSYIPEFNKLFPNITIEHTKSAGDYDTLRNNISTELTAGNSPSVAFCYPDHVALYNKAKAVVPLDGYIDSTLTTEHADGTTETMGFTQAQKDDFYQIFYDEGKSYGDGKMYTLPFYKSTEVMYYNKTFFEANDLTVPTTWEEMEAVCAEIMNIEKARVAAAGKNPDEAKNLMVTPLGYDSEANWFITMAEQKGSGYTTAEGTEHFVFDNEKNREFVGDLREWYDKKYFTTKAIYKNYTSNLFNVTDPEQMKCYMCIGSTGGAAYQVGALVDGEYAFEIGIAQIPQVDPAKPKVIQQGPSVCLFKKSNPQEVAAAWLFVKYFTTSVQFQGSASTVNGYTPVIKSVLQDENYKNWLNMPNTVEGKAKNAYTQAATVQQALNQMDSYFTSPVFDGSSAARDQVGLLMQNCFVNDMGGQDLPTFIQSQFTNIMQTLKHEYGN